MFQHLRQWIHRSDRAGPEIDELYSWAQTQGWGCRIVNGQTGGLVIDGHLGVVPFRAEWGPSQRSYIDGHELRIRVQLNAPPEFQMLVIRRQLMDDLEREAFEQFTQGNETRIDFDMPEELRWLAMFPKLGQWPDAALKMEFGALSPNPKLVYAWLEGDCGDALLQASQTWLGAHTACVLMTHRGRVYFRVQMETLDASKFKLSMNIAQIATQKAEWLLGTMSGDLGEWLSP